MSSGLFGGSGGVEWIYNPVGRVCRITLFYEQAIYGIKFCSVYEGQSIWSETFGSNAPKGYTTTICIKYPEERLTEVGGTVRNLLKGGYTVVSSLTFTTNLTVYGPFGDPAGQRFGIPILDGQMIGKIRGRSGIHLYAIGINVIPYREKEVVMNSDDDTFASKESTKKQQLETDLRATPAKSKESPPNLKQMFEEKINEIYDFAVGKTTQVTKNLAADCPVSAFKRKISAIVTSGWEKLSCEEVSNLEPLYLELIEKEGSFCEDDRLVLVKFGVAMGLMKEVERLEEMRKMLKEKEIEYRQEYARTDEYFKFMKKSIDITAEVKNDAVLLQNDYHSSSKLSVPLDFFNSVMSALVIKMEKKAENFKELEEEVGEMVTKKKFAFDLLVSIC